MSNKEIVIDVETLPEYEKKGATYSINQSSSNTFTHGMFKYPCKFIPEIPKWAINKYLKGRGVILDPFAGSGTTIVEAIVKGCDAYYTEIDEIAKLIIRVKSRALSEDYFQLIEQKYELIVKEMNNENVDIFYPGINNLRHWFSEEAITKLGRIKTLIDGIEDNILKDFFSVCFVSIIKKVSFSDDSSPKPYVSTKIKKSVFSVEKEFSNTYKRYINMVKEISAVKTLGTATCLHGDALSINITNFFDLAVTSPPYINAFDYARTLRLENLWMDYQTEETLREKKEEYVGTEKIKVNVEKCHLEILNSSELLKVIYEELSIKDKKKALIVKKFFEDMYVNLSKVYCSLKDQGVYVIVIGNSCIRNVKIESWKILRDLALRVGFSIETYFSYVIKNPYIRIPRNGKGGKINKDYVLVLRKGDQL